VSKWVSEWVSEREREWEEVDDDDDDEEALNHSFLFEMCSLWMTTANKNKITLILT